MSGRHIVQNFGIQTICWIFIRNCNEISSARTTANHSHDLTYSPFIIMEDPMFSPENLRLALEQQRREQEEEAAAAKAALARKVDQSSESIELTASFSIGTTHPNCDLNLSGQLKLTLSTNLKDIEEVLKIRDKPQRILKLREVLKFEATGAKLTIS